MDFAGKVKEVGDGVETGIKVGDDVMGMVMPSGTHGAYSDQLILNQFAVVKMPKGVSHVEASTLPMNGLTARLSLDLLNLNKGQIIAVTGGPGAYGGYAIQLAKADGLIVIADSNEQDIDLLKNLGVDHIIPRGKNFVEEIKKIFPEGVDGIADGALLNETAIGAVKDNGSFTSVRNFIGEPQRNINFTATWVSEYNCDFEKLDILRQQVDDGLVSLRVADTVTPENAAEAHRRLDAGGTRGRMVINWQ
jgi:NADPH:quinone reductase-like Zn-dependent oxidoreductase